MNGEIGTEAAQFPEKEYTNGIFLAVYISVSKYLLASYWSEQVLISIFLIINHQS